MMKKLILCISALTVVVGLACTPNSDSGDETQEDDPRIQATETRIKLALAPLGASDVVDGEGTAWTLVGDLPSVSPANYSPALPPAASASTTTDPFGSKTIEAVAEDLRAIRYQNGKVYRQRDLPIDLARKAVAEKDTIIHGNTGNPGWGGPGSRIPAAAAGLREKGSGIVGYDDRVKVYDTSVYPYRAVGQLDGDCSAFFIGPRTIVSAAHCFWNRDTNSALPFPHDFIPGRNGGDYWGNPWGPWGTWTVTTLWYPSGYQSTTSSYYDFAVLEVVPPAGVTGAPGWFGGDGSFYSAALALGYPADWGSLWEVLSPAGGCVGSANSDHTYNVTLDMENGNSGGPIYRMNTPSDPISIGIAVTKNPNRVRYWDSVMVNFIAYYSPVW